MQDPCPADILQELCFQERTDLFLGFPAVNDDGLFAGSGKLNLGSEGTTLLLGAGVLVVIVKTYFARELYTIVPKNEWPHR